MSKIIGIDLGTTNSCVSVLEGGEAKIIVNAEGKRTTPSVVAFKDGERLIGDKAKHQAITNTETVFSIKSKMGLSVRVKLGGSEYMPQEISAMILQQLKAQAEDYLGEPVTRAVITVPAHFNDAQRQATKDAGRIAGLHVERIINEPTAAALAYGLDKAEEQQTILVYDLGGGTFDVSVLELDHGLFEVKSTAGDNNLGGDDFDRVVTNYLLQEFKDKYQIDLGKDLVALSRITEEAERAKKDLSSLLTTSISLPFLAANDSGPLHLETVLTRAKFEELTKELVERTIEPTRQAMIDAGLEPHEIDKVILVGGSTRIPAVIDTVRKITGKEPFKGLNPDESVAMGAAVQGGIISGEVEDLILIDVTPLSLGIRTAGGMYTKIIPRNTPIPTSQSQIFSTATNNQHTVNVHVLQGERVMASDNKTLGNFKLTNIAPAPRGVPQIEVTFSIDRNGLVSVNARDLRTGKGQTVVMESESGLPESVIARMVEDAERNAKEDALRLKKALVQNEGANMITFSDKVITDYEIYMQEGEEAEIRELCNKLEDILKIGSPEDIESVMGELNIKLHNIINRVNEIE